MGKKIELVLHIVCGNGAVIISQQKCRQDAVCSVVKKCDKAASLLLSGRVKSYEIWHRKHGPIAHYEI